MSSISNVINYFPNRLLTLGYLGTSRVINAIDSIAQRIIQSIADKLETFPESYPRAMHVIEPVLINLFKFSNNFPTFSRIFFLSISVSICFTQTILVLMIESAFPSSFVILQPIIITIYLILCTNFTLRSPIFIIKELEERYLNKTDDITKLGGIFFNIDSESFLKLNIWAAEQRITENPNWNAARKELIRFFALPSSILNLNSRQLNSLPDIFDAPVFRKLKNLYLENNHLIDLPPSFINLRSLRTLFLNNNPTLQRVPEAIFQLPYNCMVYINNCNLSLTDLELLANRLNNDLSYNGPRINYSIRCQNSFLLYHNAKIALKKLYNINNRTYTKLSNVEEIPCLYQWLSKLFYTADFVGKLQKTVANRVIDYLEKANEDSFYRDIFSATILDSVDTCGDRVTLSLLKLGITYQLSTVDIRDTQRIHYLLTKGVWALDLLHEIARQKIPSIRGVDEIEVYLGYPIKLKSKLKLPIEVEEMLYFRFSCLTDEDLKAAQTTVLTILANEEEHLNFLISQPQWIDTLKLNYIDQYKPIEEKRDEASRIDNCNHVEIDLVYKQEVKNLTKQVIQLLNLYNIS